MKDENKIYSKPQYKCGICGTIFDSIEERMNCEANCIKKQKEEAKKAAEEKKKKEKESRKVELESAIKYAAELLNAYIKDYGTYSFKTEVLNDSELQKNIGGYFDFLPSKLLNYFLF